MSINRVVLEDCRCGHYALAHHGYRLSLQGIERPLACDCPGCPCERYERGPVGFYEEEKEKCP